MPSVRDYRFVRVRHRRGAPPQSLLIRFAGQQLARAERLAMRPDLVVEMRRRGPPGRADVADDIAALDLVAGFDTQLGQVGVPRHQSELVLDDHEIPEVRSIASRL